MIDQIRLIHQQTLSDAALEYLRRGVKAYGQAWGISFRNGYRMFHGKISRRLCRSIGEIEGWDYAHDEDAYLFCMEVDAAQDSAAAAGYPACCF